ncbi:MAG: c-type cytochrome [Planctomycetales bacterium]|nr:c-type cytochrome [Planctomycetales bacterium]
MTHSSRILLGTLGLVWFGTPPFVARSAMEHNSFADEGNRSPSAVVTATDVQKPTVLAGPLSVDNARKSFLLASSDIKIELVVSEPDVIDPVAIAFGADLVMWVAEMRDLPLGPKHGSNGRPRSRIKRLFDLNRDGRYESVTVFADELLFVTGLTPWRDGVIVTQAGEISFLADRNGDGKADFKESWFSGFLGVNPQQLVSHPTLGPDGWIYVASGHCGGIVVATKPEWKLRGQQVPIEGFDFRFNPLSGEYGVASGNGQFGLCFDDFGNRFVCSNRNPVQHVVLENEVIKRNPFLPVQTTIQDVAAFGERSKLYRLSQHAASSLQQYVHFAAARGVQIYRGDALPPEYKGNAFTCEPTANLVHREVLAPAGSTFVGHPGEHGQEFLASTDSWFRPVNLANGPDGGLYVVDMYRPVIDHRNQMPPEWTIRQNLHEATDRGRIWRITSVEPPALQERPHDLLDNMPTRDLIELLEHRNAWHRETASRLLLERPPDEVLAALKHNWKNNRLTRSRLHILWLMKLLDPRLTPAVLAWSETENRDPRVREQVVVAIGDNLEELLSNETDDLVTEETDERVRFRLILDLTSRSADAPAARAALVRLLRKGASDPWMRLAVGSLNASPPEELLLDLLADWSTLTQPVKAAVELVEVLTVVLGQQIKVDSSPPIFKRVLNFAPPLWSQEAATDVQMAAIRGLANGLSRQGQSIETHLELLEESERRLFNELLRSVQKTASSTSQTESLRLVAINTLHLVNRPEIVQSLLELATSSEPTPVRLAALEGLATLRDASIGPSLLKHFNTQMHPLRRAIIDVLLADETTTGMLLEELEKGTIQTNEIDSIHEIRLTMDKNPAYRRRTKKIFETEDSSARATIVKTYRPALERTGDIARGRLLFEKNCASCHRVAGIGVNVGPDLADSVCRTTESLLISILDPNRDVNANYFGYKIRTRDRKNYLGTVPFETTSSLTIGLPGGKEESILKAEIEEIRSTGMSLMPVGLEKMISVEQMTDLILFLKNWRYVEEGIPFGKP